MEQISDETFKESLVRDFEISESNVDVTSLDITADGSFLLAGCSNGVILLFNLDANSKNGTFLGQICAKGLHTSLIVTIIISEDGKYAFAGVNKGSMELLIFDISRLPSWENARIRIEGVDVDKRKRNPKLRGFGGVLCIKHEFPGQETPEKMEYLLACGKGIKNVHIFSFVPQRDLASLESAKSNPTLPCIYDVASNGNTLESLCFRFEKANMSDSVYSVWHFSDNVKTSGPCSLFSKSSGSNIRIWNLLPYFERVESESEITDVVSGESESSEIDSAGAKRGATTLTKCLYEDVANTQDIKYLYSKGFCFGGAYDFLICDLFAPRTANKSTIPLPSAVATTTAGVDEDGASRKRRMLRQIQTICGTVDGDNILIVCTDGGVLSYNIGECDKENNKLKEIYNIECNSADISFDTCWAMKAVSNYSNSASSSVPLAVRVAPKSVSGDSAGPIKIIVRPIDLFDCKERKLSGSVTAPTPVKPVVTSTPHKSSSSNNLSASKYRTPVASSPRAVSGGSSSKNLFNKISPADHKYTRTEPKPAAVAYHASPVRYVARAPAPPPVPLLYENTPTQYKGYGWFGYDGPSQTAAEKPHRYGHSVSAPAIEVQRPASLKGNNWRWESETESPSQSQDSEASTSTPVDTRIAESKCEFIDLCKAFRNSAVVFATGSLDSKFSRIESLRCLQMYALDVIRCLQKEYDELFSLMVTSSVSSAALVKNFCSKQSKIIDNLRVIEMKTVGILAEVHTRLWCEDNAQRPALPQGQLHLGYTAKSASVSEIREVYRGSFLAAEGLVDECVKGLLMRYNE